jgi:hypothetical protein
MDTLGDLSEEIKTDLKEMGSNCVNNFQLTHDMILMAGLCEHGHKPPACKEVGSLRNR